jgi:Eco57I restriction-modification methylase
VQEQRGEDQFHTFYRYFLVKLFHDGLNKREHLPELEALLGKVPYLNGGLFDVHVLERDYPEINIPDEAFQKLFDFFDDYDWHLDDRPLRNDKEINPDILGYIFEKYINQKQMGAYYTKEDITEYISKNTIIPYIFEATQEKCIIAFNADGPVWSLLRENPDRYIYDAVKKGCDVPLPPEVAVGEKNIAQRGEWNKPATEVYALPTEIWREVVARRTRYSEVRAKLASGEITSINDLMTYNLDIRQFAQDAIAYCEGTDLLRAFYEACLDRMQTMIEERNQLDAALPAKQRQQHPALDHFRKILREVDRHPSRTYFIYKSIIINNLYGVDIMEEATEICKLRLFLKLVSQVNTFDDIEPLPDIDFNMRAGNTLVGFASYEDTKKVIEGKTTGKGITRDEVAFQRQMIFDDRLQRIEQKAQEIERAFDNFRSLQTRLQVEAVDMAEYKQQIRQKLDLVRAELDGYLASEYAIDRSNVTKTEVYDKKFMQWQHSHQPFHWWIEFYGIMKRGGFDVIIGNPPYVEYKDIKRLYMVHGFETFSSGDLYAYVVERAYRLVAMQGRVGMIVPISIILVSLDIFLPF